MIQRLHHNINSAKFQPLSPTTSKLEGGTLPGIIIPGIYIVPRLFSIGNSSDRESVFCAQRITVKCMRWDNISQKSQTNSWNSTSPFSLWRRANARNVRLYYPYWQYTDHFIFRFCSRGGWFGFWKLHCLSRWRNGHVILLEKVFFIGWSREKGNSMDTWRRSTTLI